MLNITKNIEYSLIAIKHINRSGNIRLYSSREIADTYHIPKEIMAKAMQKLCKKGYIGAIKGAHGGYYLIKNLNNINLIDFFEDIEGPVGIVKCSTNLDCNLLHFCNIKSPIDKINKNIKKLLTNISLDEITN